MLTKTLTSGSRFALKAREDARLSVWIWHVRAPAREVLFCKVPCSVETEPWPSALLLTGRIVTRRRVLKFMDHEPVEFDDYN